MSLQVRYPKIDFESCFPHWAPDREFSMLMNASSILPAYLDPYIVKALRRRARSWTRAARGS